MNGGVVSDLGRRHVFQHAALLRRLPRIVKIDEVDGVPVEHSGPRRKRSTGMLLEILKYGKVGLKDWDKTTKAQRLRLETIDVQSKFEPQRVAGLRHPVSMMEEFDRLFQADGDEQTDHDRGNVDEEVLPSVNGLVRVYIEHGRCSLL